MGSQILFIIICWPIRLVSGSVISVGVFFYGQTRRVEGRNAVGEYVSFWSFDGSGCVGDGGGVGRAG